MKVVITEDFKQKYDELFAELQQLIGDDAGVPTVESLATYFQALSHLQEEGQTLANKFYRLPLEEPTFKVDMDSRTIEIPAVFKNNGLGVKGDTNAEVVFFEMNRWYDMMDLGQQECYIQWTNSSNRIEGNKKGNSPAIFIDKTETTLLFGWVITSNMTEQSGNLEFAIRFVTRNPDNNTLSYSLSTQKATCPVKATLDLDVMSAVGDNLENLIVTRPFYAGVINSMDGAAPTVSSNILTNLGDLVFDKEYADLTKEDAAYEDYATDYPDGILRLHIDATSPDGGTIVYRWYKDKDQATDVLTGALDTDSEYVAVKAGTYYAQIGNKSADAGRGTRWINSDRVIVPAATELQYGDISLFPSRNFSTGNEEQAMVFDVTGYNKATDVTYSWTLDGEPITEGVTGNRYMPPIDTEGIVSCTAVNRRNNTESAPLKVKQDCELRAMPDQPTSVQVKWDSTDGADGRVYVEVTFPEGSPSIKHEDEWEFSWKREVVNNNIPQGEQPFTAGKYFYPILDKPSQPGGTTSQIIRCSVQHTVFKNTGLVSTGMFTVSNQLTLTKDYDGHITAS